MPKKLTIEFVRELFKKYGKVLMATEYINARIKLQYECSCGNKECFISVSHLRGGQDNCKECIAKKLRIICMEKYGVENPMQSEEIKEKHKQTCIQNLGVEYPLQSDEIREKSKITCMQKYGVEYSSQSEEIKAKIKQTCVDNLGVDHPMKSDNIKEKHKQTCMQNHKVEYPFQSDDIRKKSKKTCMEKYGVEHPMQVEETKEKLKITCVQKYGVEHHMQVEEIAQKCFESGVRRKEYLFLNGETILYQGYENFCIDDLLLRGISEKDLIEGLNNKPEIWYEFNNKKRRYYTDIYIPSQNKIIEIKSIYTYEKELEQNTAKMNACVEQGYNTELHIYDRKGNIIKLIDYNNDETLIFADGK